MTGTSDLITRLRERGAETVALQFPAGLKRQAAGIADEIREAGFIVIISGDPCYGACDPALDLLRYADVLVHFGHTPLVVHPDIIYEPYRVDFNPEVIANVFPLLRGTAIGIITTAQ
ncbi:MAG TPA: diphthamide biosynthesis enzyme Dph2, partial [Methanoregulaceae archaeon]|nr:diphthamide biosynthesis enzyme Dph2 [Methanoregulaceae archaeon]